MKGPKVRVEEVEVTGEKLLATVKELIHQGNVRRIVIRNAKGVTLLEIPLVLGIAGAVFVPVWACLLYTSPSPRDRTRSRMPSSA